MIEIIALGLGLVLALIFVASRWGGSRAREKQSEKTAEVKDEQLDAANRRPRDKRELVDRLRDGRL